MDRGIIKKDFLFRFSCFQLCRVFHTRRSCILNTTSPPGKLSFILSHDNLKNSVFPCRTYFLPLLTLFKFPFLPSPLPTYQLIITCTLVKEPLLIYNYASLAIRLPLTNSQYLKYQPPYQVHNFPFPLFIMDFFLLST